MVACRHRRTMFLTSVNAKENPRLPIKGTGGFVMPQATAPLVLTNAVRPLFSSSAIHVV